MEIQKRINLVKSTLESFLTTETSKEQVDAIAKANQALDEVVSSNSDLQEQLTGIRKDYIDMVKHMGFKGTADDYVNENAEPQARSFEEIAQEIIAKRKK